MDKGSRTGKAGGGISGSDTQDAMLVFPSIERLFRLGHWHDMVVLAGKHERPQ